MDYVSYTRSFVWNGFPIRVVKLNGRIIDRFSVRVELAISAGFAGCIRYTWSLLLREFPVQLR